MAAQGHIGAERYAGRLFSDENGRLYYILDVDMKAQTARVGYRESGRQQVIEMPIGMISARLDADAELQLDGLHSADTTRRVLQKSDGWFFATREGLKGPYGSEEDAGEALSEHILAAQSRRVTGV